MYLYILYTSFISFLVSILYGKHLGTNGTAFITVLLLLVCNLCSIYIFYEVCCLKMVCYIDIVRWISVDYMNISYSFVFDSLTAVMLIVVSSISLFAHIYSVDYMRTDAHIVRFLSYLSLFTFSMLILVSANNLLLLFIGWEGVGLCSYLLINFWFVRIQSNKAALKALFINKISDLSLLFGIALLYSLYFSLDFSVVYSPILYLLDGTYYLFGFGIDILYFVCLLLFIGAMGKSAQIGLHLWLPDAMEGPTPVSSLIHAATMVTAGVFLLVRTSFLFEFVNSISLCILLIGALTIFFSSTVGIFQNDIKKVIAYSTCSQIGYMIFICGFGGYSLSIFHLFNHAFFKALLFLAAGSIIHANSNEQDIRKMGGLFKLIPVSYVSFFIGSISLAGFPFLTGYYSKDLLVELSYLFTHEFFVTYLYSAFVIKAFYWITLVSIILTSIYSLRLLCFVFLCEYNGFLPIMLHIKDCPFYMNTVLCVLSMCSIFIGFFAYDTMVGFGTDFWQNSLFVYFLFDYEFIHSYVKLLPILYSMYGLVFCVCFYNIVCLYRYFFCFQVVPFLYKVLYFLNRKWYFDKLYNDSIVHYVMNVFSYNVMLKLLDKGIIDFLGPYGIVRFSSANMNLLSQLQTGFVYHYAGIVLNCILLFFMLPALDLALHEYCFVYFAL